MRLRTFLSVIIILISGTMIFAQSARIRGKVLDSSGLVIPGAQIRVLQSDKVVKEAKAGPAGDFDISMPPGDYKLEVTAPDFQPHNQNVKATPTAAALTIAM